MLAITHLVSLDFHLGTYKEIPTFLAYFEKGTPFTFDNILKYDNLNRLSQIRFSVYDTRIKNEYHFLTLQQVASLCNNNIDKLFGCFLRSNTQLIFMPVDYRTAEIFLMGARVLPEFGLKRPFLGNIDSWLSSKYSAYYVYSMPIEFSGSYIVNDDKSSFGVEFICFDNKIKSVNNSFMYFQISAHYTEFTDSVFLDLARLYDMALANVVNLSCSYIYVIDSKYNIFKLSLNNEIVKYLKNTHVSIVECVSPTDLIVSKE
jgi:hypothetical protein